jgi:signal transduction histidine kinase
MNMKKNYLQAYQYYKEAEKFLQKTSKTELIHKIRVYSGLANVLYYLDSAKLAFEYERKAHLTQDSLERFQKGNQVLQSQLKFLLRNQEENYLLEKKVNEQIDFWTRVGIIILLVIVVILGYLLRRQSRLNKLIALQKMRIEAKNEEISRQNIELAEKKQEVESQQQTIEQVNEILERYTKNLEAEVEKRTQEIREKNTALLQTVSQLEQFSYILAHNVRSPIARLQGLLMCLDMENISNPQNLKIFEFVQQSAKELDDTIKNLNTIIQIRKGVNEIYEKVDLKRKIEKQRAAVMEAKGILEVDLQVRYVYAIKAYAESIFYNLISNAIKYRDTQRQLVIKVRTYQDDTFLYVEVEDNGIGIDLAKNKDKMFGFYKRFHSSVDVEGKGIGLHIVKLQVEAMGGKIEVESELGKGTKFKMTFKKPAQIDWENV